MTRAEIEQYIKKNWLLKSNLELANDVGKGLTQVRNIARAMGLPKKTGGTIGLLVGKITTEEQIKLDREKILARDDSKNKEKKYKTLLEKNEKLEKELDASIKIEKGIKPLVYSYTPFSKDTESIAVVLASDWHIEENVKAETVDGFNAYSLAIAHQRAEQFFKTTVRLVEIEGAFSKIDTLVLALLGDFISGNIHEALLEINELEPINASIEAENILIGGIQYILDNSKLNLIIPCTVGNHSRITKRVHIATEQGNSLETIIYHHIKNHFKNNPRVKVIISQSYLLYISLWDYNICFQHGHAVNYGGGVGGITIPLKKAVAQWQKKRRVNLYCLGHWHQMIDIGEAIVNGSMIGYSSYVQFIKADPERPKQVFFVINKKFNDKISVRPILFSI